MTRSAAGQLLVRTDEGRVARLTLADPARRNALSQAMISAITTELGRLAEDPAILAIVIAAEGPVFCAGHDLREIEAGRSSDDQGRLAFEQIIEACTGMMVAIVACPKPVIACVEGLATAAGCQLVASCDLAIAGERASFCTPGVNIGLFCSTPSVPLLRNVALKPAMQMLLTGEPIGAAEALRLGLVNAVVPAGEALDETVTLAMKLTTKSPDAIRRGKALMAAERISELREAYAQAGRTMVENMLAADAIEGIGAFLEKRNPEWKD